MESKNPQLERSPLEFAEVTSLLKSHEDGGIRIVMEIGEVEKRYLFIGRRSAMRLLHTLLRQDALPPGCAVKIGPEERYSVDLNSFPLT